LVAHREVIEGKRPDDEDAQHGNPHEVRHAVRVARAHNVEGAPEQRGVHDEKEGEEGLFPVNGIHKPTSMFNELGRFEGEGASSRVGCRIDPEGGKQHVGQVLVRRENIVDERVHQEGAKKTI
jgi:hypothetical protein